MADYACDTLDGNQATISVSNMQDGSVQFLCTACAGLFGVMLIRELYPDMWTELTAPPTPPAAKKPRLKSGKTAATPDDPGRVVVEIVETGPRPDGETEGDDECPACGAMVKDSEQEQHYRTEHADLPPY